ncbi:MAG: hypothetical protein GY858_03885 [Candidatus Omnitrophica bacterium]|nr:hypothetical protein [Candidatus Omnitrophota bacterium]
MKKFFLLLICITFPFSLFAQERKLLPLSEGKYFSVYGDNLNAILVLEKINSPSLVSVDSIFTKTDNLYDVLAETLDNLYSEVSDILDIHMYSFHSKIHIVRDKFQLNSILNRRYKMDFTKEALYLHEENTIYVSLEDLTLGMLGHEIGHAIVSRYFVVPPPVKVQEVLCGYVEYNLRKKTKEIPH